MAEPTSKELARRTGTYGQATLSERQQYAQALANAGELLPKNFWSSATKGPDGQIIPPAPSPGKVLMMTETAAMLGIHPMAGLTQIHIIEGKPTLSAALWGALVREAGHRLRVWTEGSGDSLKAIATLVRADDPDFEYRVEWGMAEMRDAGLSNKDNWKKYRRSMMKSRAITEVIREGAPEVGMGAAYTPEEINPNLQVNEQGDPVELQVVPQVGQEQPRAERVATPIKDDVPPEAPDDGIDYVHELENVSSSAEASDLYQSARKRGDLTRPVTVGDTTQELGQFIIQIGKALAAAEMDASTRDAEPSDQPHDDGSPAVLDEDVIESEIIEDENEQ